MWASRPSSCASSSPAVPEDVAIGISTSGGSPNILAALAEARKRACSQWASLATTGEVVSERLADHAVVVRSDYIPRIQEVQASVYHVLRGLIETLTEQRVSACTSSP